MVWRWERRLALDVAGLMIAASVGLASSTARAQRPTFDSARWHLPDTDRPAGGSAPETRDDPGGPVPTGWRRVHAPTIPLIVAGSVVAVLGYGLGLLGTVSSCSVWRNDCALGWIPGAGPFVLLAGGTVPVPMMDRTGTVVVTGVFGAIQALGTVGTIVGLSLWHSQLVRLTPVTSFDPRDGGVSVGARLQF